MLQEPFKIFMYSVYCPRKCGRTSKEVKKCFWYRSFQYQKDSFVEYVSLQKYTCMKEHEYECIDPARKIA